MSKIHVKVSEARPERMYVCVCAQLCPTLWGPINCSLPGSSAHGIFQARILEWVVILYFRVKCIVTATDEFVH